MQWDVEDKYRQYRGKCHTACTQLCSCIIPARDLLLSKHSIGNVAWGFVAWQLISFTSTSRCQGHVKELSITVNQLHAIFMLSLA